MRGFLRADKLARQDKLDRKTDEALRLVKIYITNRLIALQYWRQTPFGRASASMERQLREDLGQQIRSIAQSLPLEHPLIHLMHSFADNLEQIWGLPDPLALVRRMHRELDPEHERRSILPDRPEASWRDWRYDSPSWAR